MMTPEEFKVAAKAAADERDCDLLLVNAGMMPGLEVVIRTVMDGRATKRPGIILILVTPGGVADTAYRAAVSLHARYDYVAVCVPGWCKSAGTLLAIGGHELIFGDAGELGPLDVQIAKKDDLGGDRDSGLILNEALERLRDESFGIFENFMLRIIAQSNNAITFRTAADLAVKMTTGLMAPIFEKIDPIRMGADARAMNIGRDYAVRLNMKGENLRGDEALNMLLNGYPSHSFAIDYDEASRLFINVKALDGTLANVIAALGDDARKPSAENRVCYVDGVGDAGDGNGVEGGDMPIAGDDGSAVGNGDAPAEDV